VAGASAGGGAKSSPLERSGLVEKWRKARSEKVKSLCGGAGDDRSKKANTGCPEYYLEIVLADRKAECLTIAKYGIKISFC